MCFISLLFRHWWEENYFPYWCIEEKTERFFALSVKLEVKISGMLFWCNPKQAVWSKYDVADIIINPNQQKYESLIIHYIIAHFYWVCCTRTILPDLTLPAHQGSHERAASSTENCVFLYVPLPFTWGVYIKSNKE